MDRGNSEGVTAFRKGDRVMIDGDPTHTGTVRWVVDRQWHVARPVAVWFGPRSWVSYEPERLTLITEDQGRKAA